MRSLIICNPQPYCAGNKIEKNEMGGACSSDWEGKDMYRLLVGNLKEKDHLGDPGLDGRII
jgi:hypothetical protein